MPACETARPVLIEEQSARSLERVRFVETSSEAWLQDLLEAHPTLLPCGEIEPAAGDSVVVAREVPLGHGFLDLLLVNGEGFLTLVETKLWRNPEARRSVVAQIIEYASEMSRLGYDQLCDAIREATGRSGDALLGAIRQTYGVLDETRFADAVNRNLSRGRFLLLIVGDGIQEGIEHMSDFLQRTPQLGFTLGLVEMAVYRLKDGQDRPLLVQPRILGRTREVVRAVVEIQGAVNPKQVRVTLPTDPAPERVRSKLTEEAFFERLVALNDPVAVETARWLLDNVPKRGLRIDWGKESFTICHVDEESGRKYSMGLVTEDGRIPIYMLFHQCENYQLPDRLWREYYEDVARLIAGARVVALPRKGKPPRYEVFATAEDQISLTRLAPKREQWLEAISAAVERIRAAVEEGTA